VIPLGLASYREFRSRFSVSPDLARRALAWAQPLAMQALGIHTQRQTLVEGELPAYLLMTRPETNGGWGELMPVWFKPYERPVPLYCLDNWGLFASLYFSAFGLETDHPAFSVKNLVRVVMGADLLIPFLPGTAGVGRFLRHGALPILLSILWLEPDARDAWLAMHISGARTLAGEHEVTPTRNLADWLESVEADAWLAPTRELIAGEGAVAAFLADATRAPQYQALFRGLCLSVASLAAAWGVDWRRWVFQAVNVGYRTREFALADIVAWLGRTAAESGETNRGSSTTVGD
jgi:hypothetical protein